MATNTTLATAAVTDGASSAPTTGTDAAEPKAKKSRTNTPWTAAEEQRLKQMRDAGNSWSEIAKVKGPYLAVCNSNAPPAQRGCLEKHTCN